MNGLNCMNHGVPERIKKYVDQMIAEAKFMCNNTITIAGTIKPNLRIYLSSNIMLEKIICKDSDLATLVADEIKSEYRKQGYEVTVRTNATKNMNRITKAIIISWVPDYESTAYPEERDKDSTANIDIDV